jgi:hypothetical protein
MSTNVAMLTLGIIVAGHLTDTVGARWVWAAAAATSAVAGVIGLAFARRAEDQPLAAPREPEPIRAPAAASEPTQRAL